jgi:nucleoid-associated protein YgaU
MSTMALTRPIPSARSTSRPRPASGPHPAVPLAAATGPGAAVSLGVVPLRAVPAGAVPAGVGVPLGAALPAGATVPPGAVVSPRAAAPVPQRRSRVAAPAAPPGELRLTRRGRVVVVLLFLGVLLAVLTAFGAHSAATREPGAPLHTRTVVVDRGDTLWGIAASAAGPGQVREMVHEIEELNAMTGPGLTVGQKVAVPVR